MLSFRESLDILKRYGIPMPKYSVYPEKIDSEIVVLKVSSKDVIHKTDVGGIILNVSKEDIDEKTKYLLSKFPKAEIIVQEQLNKEKYLEIIIGIKKDSIFDYFVLIGLGGIYTEIFKDFVILVPDFDKNDFLKGIKELKSFPILNGYRKNVKANLDRLYEIVKKFEEIFIKEGLEELEINPLFINDKEVYAIDARMKK